MGKKKRSTFVQQQNYNRHLQNKTQSNLNHRNNQFNKAVDREQQKMEESTKKIMHDFCVENGLDPNTIPSNSRIIIFELLRKNMQNKLDMYNQFIQNNQEDENISQINEAIELCKSILTQIDWIYDWTQPLDNSDYDLLEVCYKDLLDEANTKLKESGKKFDDLETILNTAIIPNREKYNDLSYYFYKLCYFIVKNDIDQYHTYISNTIKNLSILNSKDPIVEYMIKRFIVTDEIQTQRTEN